MHTSAGFILDLRPAVPAIDIRTADVPQAGLDVSGATPVIDVRSLRARIVRRASNPPFDTPSPTDAPHPSERDSTS